MAVYDRDYLTTLPLLYDKAAEYSGGDWNKYNSDVGDAILRLIASSSHSVDYYFRKFLTALVLPNDDPTQRALIWELTGYKPNYLRADYLMVQLYWPECGLDTYVPLYQYTPFKITADGKEYTFLCAQDYMIQPLTTRINIRLVNGTLNTLDLDYGTILNNKVKLSDNDIDYDLVTLIVSGIKWTQVRNVFYSPDTERIYSIHKEDDGTYLYLHKSWQTYVDSYDTSFVIYFVESIYDFSIFTDDCMKVEFQTELLTLDGDDVSEFYRIIPLLNSDEAIDASNLLPSTTEGNRAITTLDYETNAALFPGIASCRSYDWNTSEVCKVPFEVDLIACDANGNLSEHMRQVLASYLESIGSPLITVKVIPPKFEKYDLLVILDIGDYKGTVAERELKKQVVRALEDFFDVSNMKPGRVVSTKELNSLLLHADSRIYFATCSFLNSPSVNPVLIPSLGEVVVITSAEAYYYFDYGEGFDKGTQGVRPYERVAYSDNIEHIGMFFSYTLHANILLPIDKLPMQLFESPAITVESSLELGLGDYMISDFGYGADCFHILATGGDENGPLYAFIYETDGTTVLAKLDMTLMNTVTSNLQFVNSQGTFNVDPQISSISLVSDSVDDIKSGLAQAIDSVPGLVNASGYPFSITGDDIIYAGDTLLSPLKLSGKAHTGSIQGNTLKSDIFMADTEISPKTAPVGGSGADQERLFAYLPYNVDVREYTGTTEKSDVHKINFVIKQETYSVVEYYDGFSYASKGRYNLNPKAYGDMFFAASVSVMKHITASEFVPVRPDVYKEQDHYNSSYYVKEKNGTPLHWYFVSTSPIHDVDSTVEIGYGIYVMFKLLRDQAIYVETDVMTSRGFIYSAEMQSVDFTIIDF